MRDWKTIAANYRPMEGAVLHPDDCVVIRIKGAEWYVRPLQLPAGIMYTPEFGEKVEFRQTIDPLGNEPMQKMAADLIESIKVVEGLSMISSVCSYLSALLDQQYELSDEIKGDLLSFRMPNIPPWIYQSTRHASGLSPQPSAGELSESLSPEPEPEPEPAKKKWWKFF